MLSSILQPSGAITSQRVNFYTRCMYSWATYFSYIPFQYTPSVNGPNSIIPLANSSRYRKFAICPTLIFALMLFSLYSTIGISDQLSIFEVIFMVGLNFIFMMMHASQWFFSRPVYPSSWLTICQLCLEFWFREGYLQPPSFEILYFIVCSGVKTYPILYFPFTVLTAWGLPWTFILLNSATEAICVGLDSLCVSSRYTHACLRSVCSRTRACLR